MSEAIQSFSRTLADLKAAGHYKNERIITSPMGAEVTVEGRTDPALIFCSNNYLGLADHPEIIEAAKHTLDTRGFGLASVRFICGTQDIHKQLEAAISRFFGTEDSILYSSCFDANVGIFESLLGENDCILSDALNHASIIDGVRLCKARRERYEHCNMQDLEQRLRASQECGIRLISTDGVFSMDGDIAPLAEICELARKYGALVHIDDSHATGFLGQTGRGTAEHCHCLGQVDVITSTLGKALGGGSGGFTTGRREIIAMLRQRSRPYLFSNTVPPPIVGAALKTFEILSASTQLRDKLAENTRFFREKMTEAGFSIRPSVHPIVSIMIGDARLANEFAEEMLQLGIYVVPFSFPVVSKGMARIRVQISAAHTREQLERAIACFLEVGRAKGIVHSAFL
ncbi:glycine C-acetyltransferase [Paratrimastix pyriformis]|uniref:Glycine C-acetyltransferase n=1 Tax=Paratrimastix pyriformis TaxID=342808 RepID=A0ABQ8UQ35_9EUKA|nr:glycine C-acetyltransferase [Paratrimastix pyriformis]